MVYDGVITFRNETNGRGDTVRGVSLSVASLGAVAHVVLVDFSLGTNQATWEFDTGHLRGRSIFL